jgi:alkanesulfonate monooxygenase SsuD/methylene tetrahydromethanopterin reductase-like flavin-dependent oxidoreductase (luciferase family)
VNLSLSLNPAGVSADQLLAAAATAERAGYHAVYLYDHISGVALGGGPAQHVWSVLGAMANATSRVGIGPLVCNVTSRPAVDIAIAVATLQDLSGGRLLLGLGAGSSGDTIYTAEMDMFRLPAEPAAQRRARVVETIAFLRSLWRGDDEFAGRWASFGGVRDVGRPHPVPPIIVGANGPRMADIAGRHADAVNFHSYETDLGGLAATARAAAAQAGTATFRVTVEARWHPDWVDGRSDGRRRLAAAGVDELILTWTPPIGLKAITASTVPM